MRKIALGLCLAVAALAGATNVYTTEASFLPNIQAGYYLENFTGWTYGSPLGGSTFDWDAPGANGYNFHAYALNGLWSNVQALSTNTASDPLVITFPNSLTVTAFGGIMSSTDISGNVIPQDITITLNDGTTTKADRSHVVL